MNFISMLNPQNHFLLTLFSDIRTNSDVIHCFIATRVQSGCYRIRYSYTPKTQPIYQTEFSLNVFNYFNIKYLNYICSYTSTKRVHLPRSRSTWSCGMWVAGRLIKRAGASFTTPYMVCRPT